MATCGDSEQVVTANNNATTADTETQLDETRSAVSTKLQNLRNRKKSAKTRLTKAQNRLRELLDCQPNGKLARKNAVRRSIRNVNAEFSIIEQVIVDLRQIYAVSAEYGQNEQVDATIEALDKELEEIALRVDASVEGAEQHIQDRLTAGEEESTASRESREDSPSVVSAFSALERKKLEAQDASERLERMEEIEKQQEENLRRLTAELHLTKNRTQEARQVAALNQARAEAAEQEARVPHVARREFEAIDPPPAWQPAWQPQQRQPARDAPHFIQSVVPIKLKGVELPTFSGHDKTDYEPWKAAFMSMVDRANIPANEKMLRLQNSLTGKAQTLVKDLGYSEAAYVRAKEKLEKKYGGERRLQIKHLTTLRGWPKVRPRNLEDMESFLAVLERVMIALQDSMIGNDLQGQSLNLTAKEKLAEDDVQAYKYWLIDRCLEEAKEETRGIGNQQRTDRPDDRRSDRRDDPRRRLRGFNTMSKAGKCVVSSCGQDHPPWACRIFRELPISERKEAIARSKRCFGCLAAGHKRRECPNARRCGIDGCNSSQHSRYLHEPKHWEHHDSVPSRPPRDAAHTSAEENTQRGRNTSEEARGSLTHPTASARTHITNKADNVSLMVLPAAIVNGSRRLNVNVMLDPCSTGSYVTEAAAEELGLQGESQSLTISGTGGSMVKKRSRHVADLNDNFSAKVQANVLDSITGDTPAFEWSEMKANWPHLTSVPFHKMAKRPQIDVLIGSDYPVFHHVLSEKRGQNDGDPIARMTNLGWVCFGPTLVENFRRKSRSHFTRTYRSSHAQETQPSEDILRKFWELESLGIKEEKVQALKPNDKRALDQVTDTLQFTDGRYEVGIPWKEGEPKLEDNYEGALTRLKSQEKSLTRKGPEIKKAYSQVLECYEKKGYIRKVSASELGESQWFLPHFPVIKEDRTTTKVRIVFDAAVKYGGKSLNDAIHPGPKLQRELVDVLTRFRRAPVALSGDISEMFLQVGLRKEDRPYHRFLWRDFDAEKKPEVYEFQRLVFGNTASPFCSQHVLHTHAQAHSADYPEAAETVDNSMYVDDVLDSCETTDEAKQLRQQLSNLLSMANFKLRKWASNEPAVVEDVPEDDRLNNLIIQGEEAPKVKILGVIWEAQRDIFTFKVKQPECSNEPTKRSVLRAIATLFDPLQFLSPFTLRAKLLMQEIWMAGLDWDDVLTSDLKTKWERWVSELPQLSNVTIPRCLRQPSPEKTHLHVFSDASKDAYASAAYLVCQYPDNSVSSHLIASKSRVAPVKAMTIPRLELMGAVLSTRLAQNIVKTLTVEKTIYWTDSENVWYWVRNQSRDFKPFVANRIGEIQRSTSPEQWRHVPGESNPADLPTRGLTASELVESTVWMEGPDFLKSDESTWPKTPTDRSRMEPDDQERRKITQTHWTENSKPRIDPSHFSSLRRLLHVTGWIMRYLNNCKLPEESRVKGPTLTTKEVKDAETYWIKRAQAEAFPRGEAEASLARLNPKRDENGLLRSDGRLGNADDLPYDVKHPIILPKDHPITKHVVVSTHERLGHGSGVEHVLTELRARFWVVKGRRVVRSIIATCLECRRRFTTRPAGQMMAPLPRSRLQASARAFERVGVDYAGPFLTRQGRGKKKAKRYMCLFTCLATRAVHLEMSYSLDTDSFINAFTRMTSRRGMPTYVLSDNGTNFVGAERELRELVEGLDKVKISLETTRNYHINWEFNPPSAPHFGGVYEAMIRSAKKAIKAILGDADVFDEEFQTAICGAERLLNSRPITYVSSDPNDLSPLTPNHFIIGQMGGSFAPDLLSEDAYNPRKRWHRVQQLLGQCWKRWRKEFLPSLNVRRKWFHPKHNLEEGDVVLMVEPNASRGEWPLGRVVEAYPGSDGLVRVVKVKARNKEYLRPVHRLCPLEYAEDHVKGH